MPLARRTAEGQDETHALCRRCLLLVVAAKFAEQVLCAFAGLNPSQWLLVFLRKVSCQLAPTSSAQLRVECPVGRRARVSRCVEASRPIGVCVFNYLICAG